MKKRMRKLLFEAAVIICITAIIIPFCNFGGFTGQPAEQAEAATSFLTDNLLLSYDMKFTDGVVKPSSGRLKDSGYNLSVFNHPQNPNLAGGVNEQTNPAPKNGTAVEFDRGKGFAMAGANTGGLTGFGLPSTSNSFTVSAWIRGATQRAENFIFFTQSGADTYTYNDVARPATNGSFRQVANGKANAMLNTGNVAELGETSGWNASHPSEGTTVKTNNPETNADNLFLVGSALGTNWIHILVSVTNNDIIYYRNGLRVLQYVSGTTNVGKVIPNVLAHAKAGKIFVHIGNQADSTDTEGGFGMDELRFYDRSVTDAEATAIYNDTNNAPSARTNAQPTYDTVSSTISNYPAANRTNVITSQNALAPALSGGGYTAEQINDLKDRLSNDYNAMTALGTIDSHYNNYNSAHSSILGKTADNIAISDKAAVQAAKDAYPGQYQEVKDRLLTNFGINGVSYFDALLAEIQELEYQVEAANFRDGISVLLGLSPGDIRASHRAAVDSALGVYDGLSDGVQAYLITEKDTLDGFQTVVAYWEEWDVYAAAHNVALALDTETAAEMSVKSDVRQAIAAVDAAITAFNGLSDGTQGWFSAEETNLSSVLSELSSVLSEIFDSERTDFRQTHAVILDILEGHEPVLIAYNSAVASALSDYGGLDTEVKALLSSENTLLTSAGSLISGLITGYETVNALIDALPSSENTKIADDAQINGADAAYIALSDDQKSYITDLEKLEDAKQALEREYTEILETNGYIMYLPVYSALTVGNWQTAKINAYAAHAIYETLDADQRAELLDEEKFLLCYSVVSVIDIIDAIPPYAELNALTFDVYTQAAEAARLSYTALSATLQGAVFNFQELIDIENQLNVLSRVMTTVRMIEALPEPENITLSDADDIAAAKLAYGNISFTNQPYVINYQKLQYTESVLAYRTANAGILAKTTVTITASTADKDAVALALSDYNSSTYTAVRSYLASDYALLLALQNRIADIEAVAAVVNLIAALPAPAEIILSDEAAVDTARAAYEALREDIKPEVDNYQKLTGCEAEILDLSYAKYLTDHADALALLAVSVEISDKDAVSAAITAYDGLKQNVKDLLTDEIARLNGLSVRITDLETVRDFKAEYSALLLKVYDAVTVSDETEVSSALTALGGMTPEAAAMLSSEETLLNAMFTYIGFLHEAADFRTLHSGILGTETSALALSDEPALSAAEGDYDVLAQEVKDLLTSEFSRLTALSERLLKLKAADAYRTLHSYILSLAAATIVLDDETDLISALSDYGAADDEVKDILASEYALLVSLETAIGYQKDAKAFTDANSALFTKEIGEIVLSDKATINSALSSYNGLLQNVKNLLTAEKSKLDSFANQIANLEAEQFKSTYASLLILTTATVQLENKPTVSEALSVYGGLDSATRTKLLSENTLLLSLSTQIGYLETAAAFRTTYAALLSATYDTVQISNKTSVSNAIGHYESLNPNVRALLDDEYDHFSLLLQAIKDKEDAQTFIGAHTAALSLEISTVTADDKDIIENTLTAYGLCRDEVQALLTAQYAKLLALSAQISYIEDADVFASDNAYILEKTEDALTYHDSAYIISALAEYDALADEVKALLGAEYLLLVALESYFYDILEPAILFVANNPIIDMSVGDVGIGDKADVLSALSDFAALTEAVRLKLSEENQKLLALEEQIGYLEQADDFKTTFAALLATETENIAIDDKADVLNALSVYEPFAPAVRQMIADEYIHILELAARISYLEIQAVTEMIDTLPEATLANRSYFEDARAAYDALSDEQQGAVINYDILTAAEYLIGLLVTAEQFRTDYGGLLQKQADEITLSDENGILNALGVLGGLDDDALSYLTDEYLHILSLHGRLAALYEQDGFLTEYASLLNKTALSVSESDKPEILAALADYLELSSDAKTLLDGEFNLISALYDAVLQKQADAFTAAHSAIIATTAETLVISDKDALTRATEEFALLDDDVKEILLSVYDRLETLNERMLCLETASEFRQENSEILGKDDDDLGLDDYDSLAAALENYDNLDDDVKDDLSDEHDALLSKLGTLDGIAEDEAEHFKQAYSDILEKTSDDFDITDKESILNAIDELEHFHVLTREKLTGEKGLLTEFYVIIGYYDAADAFKASNAYLLSLDIAELDLNDEAALLSAITEFNALSDEVRTLLAVEGIRLSGLTQRFTDLEIAETVITRINALGNPYALTLDDKAEIQSARGAYNNLSEAQKGIVGGLYDNLVAAETQMADLEKATVAFNIADIFSDKAATLSDKAVIVELRGIFNTLSTRQVQLTSGLLGYDFETALLALETRISGLEIAYAESLIGAIPAKVALSDGETIKKAREAYNSLTEAQQPQVENYSKLTAAEGVYEELEITNVITLINKIPSSLTYADRAFVYGTLSSYNMLTAKQKAKITNYASLQASLSEMVYVEAAEKYKTEYLNILAKTVNNIKITDENLLTAAFYGYNGLSDEVKIYLTAEYAHLNALDARIEDLKKSARLTTALVIGISIIIADSLFLVLFVYNKRKNLEEALNTEAA